MRLFDLGLLVRSASDGLLTGSVQVCASKLRTSLVTAIGTAFPLARRRYGTMMVEATRSGGGRVRGSTLLTVSERCQSHPARTS